MQRDRRISNKGLAALFLAIVMIFGLLGPVVPAVEAAEGYTLTYDSNRAGHGSVPGSVTSSVYGEVTVAGQSGDPLMRDGYVFVGWNEAQDGSGTLYMPDDSLTLTDDTTLYANWAPKFEGEDAILLQGAEIENFTNASGGKHVGYLSGDGDGVTFEGLPATKFFLLRYASEEDGEISLYVNGEYRQHIEFESTGDWGIYQEILIDTAVDQGDSLSIIYRDGDNSLNVDYIAAIVERNVDVESVVLSNSELAVTVNRSESLTATVLPTNASNKKIVWSSSNSSVVNVNSRGVVKGISQGTATITAAAQDNLSIFATVTVTVNNPAGGQPYAAQVSAGGGGHFLALMSDGTVMALGNNSSGQLGDGTYNESYEEPVLVLKEDGTVLEGIQAIAAGGYHNLALDQEGQVWAWGYNYYGQAGVVDQGYVPYATRIEAFVDQEITAIGAGYYHSLALDSEGQVWAWGYNSNGELGIGSYSSQVVPMPVQTTAEETLADISAISAGGYESLALDQDGRIWAWGDGYGLNPDPFEDSSDWTLAGQLSQDGDVFTAISAGYTHNLAIDSQGGVRAWGAVWDPNDEYADTYYNDALTLGDGTLAATKIFSTGYYTSSSYIQLADGSNWCWGSCLSEDGSSTMEVAPKKRMELQGFTTVAGMDWSMVGLKSDDTVWWWNTDLNYIETPMSSTVTDIVEASAGANFSLALKSDGRVYGWGNNEYGQSGTKTDSYNVRYNAENPAAIVDGDNNPIENISAIAAGGYHALALTTGGEVWAWGGNWDTQIGTSISSDGWIDYARLIPDLTNVTAVSAGDSHSMALRSDGTVVTWGDNEANQLGVDTDEEPSATPVVVDGVTDVKAIAAGYHHGVAVTGDEGYVWSWGDYSDTKAQIYVDEDTPLSGITEVAAGYDITIALKNDGTVWGWGTYDEYATPIESSTGPLTGIKQIAMAYYNALALDSNGDVWEWGNNNEVYKSKSDDGSLPRKNTSLSGIKQVAVGYYHRLAVAQNGTLKGYGSNYYEQLALLIELHLNQVTAFRTKDSSGNTPGGGGSSSGGAVEIGTITTTNGKITVPVGRAGETKLDEEIFVSIPSGASAQELSITIEKLLDTANLASQGEVFASPVFELLKNFSENFVKPIKLTFKFDASKIKEGQHASIFYYDETEKTWVEVGGQVAGDTISVEVDHFTKFAVLAVGETEEPEIPSFSDIAGHWAAANIQQAVQQGIVNGYPDGTFKPNATVTRAEFTVMLTNALKLDGEDAQLSFTDEQKIGAWAKSAIAKSVNAGIVSGYGDGSFRPSANITRAELAVMVARAYGASTPAGTSTGFADDGDIPAWATAAIAQVKSAGIVSGQGGNRFAPKANATRAEAVTIILNLLKAK